MRPFDPEKPPPFPLARIVKIRDKAYPILEAMAGRKLEGDDFQGMLSGLSAVLLRSPTDPVVLETARSLPLTVLTQQDVFDLCWRLAANAQRIKKGLPVRPWSGQVEPEWVAFEILSVRFRRHKVHGPGYVVGFRALSGSPCAARFERFWTRSSFYRYGYRIGFTRRGRRTLPLADPLQMVRLRFAAVVPPGERLTFTGLTAPATLKAFNKKILKARIWRQPACPHGYAHACHVCPVGYAVGAAPCPASCHPCDWSPGYCPVCRAESWFDAAVSVEICLACLRSRSTGP